MENDIVSASVRAGENTSDVKGGQRVAPVSSALDRGSRLLYIRLSRGGEIMKMGIRTRCYPNELQNKWLKSLCIASNEMWNFLVNKYKDAEELPVFTKFGIKDYGSRQLLDDIGFHNAVPERVALGVLRKYSQTWKMFFKRDKYPQLDLRPPREHDFNPTRMSFCLASSSYEVMDGEVPCPSVKQRRAGKVALGMKYIDKLGISKISEPHFTCEYGRWYVSGSYEIDPPEPNKEAKTLGMDWGYKNFFTTDTGEYINYPKSVLREFNRINHLKSTRDKKVKGSKNYRRLNKKVAKSYQRFEGLKRDFIEQTTTKLARQYNIAVEDLTGITKSIQSKYKKKRYDRYAQIAPRYHFVLRLKQKAGKFGTVFVEVDPNDTSKMCSRCGNIKEELHERERVYVCAECGLVIDRDQNAAINIAAKGFC
jgi:IS605 OrfB family transposase